MTTTHPALLETEQTNPFSLSKQYLLVATFNKSSSKNFQTALLWARSAEVFEYIEIDKDTIYLCAFGKTAEQAAMASVFLNYIENWNGKQIYVGGRIHPSSIYDLLGLLDCYQKSQSCPNPKSHCCFISDDIFLWRGERPAMITIGLGVGIENEKAPAKKKFVMPCRKLHQHRIERETYIGEWDEQISALAVRENVDWCPSFDISVFRQFD